MENSQTLKEVREKWNKENSRLGLRQQAIAKQLCMGDPQLAVEYAECAVRQEMTDLFFRDLDRLAIIGGKK